MRDDLLSAGPVISTDGHYTAGRHATAYRLCSAYHRTEKRYCEDHRINKLVAKYHRGRDRTARKLHEWDERLGTAIKADAIIPACADLVPQRTRRPAKAGRRSGGVAQTPEERAAEYRTSTASMVRRWAAEHGWFVRDRFGRIHTPFTSLPRPLGPLLRYHDRSTIGVDVGAMQMVCAYLLAVRWCP